MIVALTGFMGCGKSSVGRELSTLLSIPVVDLDQYIVERAGMSIPDIFAERGEQGFRDLETKALKEVLGRQSPSGNCATLGNIRGGDPSLLGGGPKDVSGGALPPQNFILSLGGGTILGEENAALIKQRCKCFFLRASVETLKLHLGGEQSNRPLLRSGGFEALLQERTPRYTAAADFIIDIDNLTPMQIAGIIANLIS